MLSLHSPTACGGIGAITLMVGAAILTMAGDGTAGTVRAGALAGAAGTAVAGGDIIITITIIPDIIPVEDTGVGDTGHVIRIRTVVLREQAVTAILLQQSAGQVQA